MEAIDKSRIFMLELMFGYLHYEEHICNTIGMTQCMDHTLQCYL